MINSISTSPRNLSITKSYPYLIRVEGEEYHDQIDVTIQPTSRRKARGTADIAYWTMERPLSKTEEELEVRDVSVLKDYLKGY